uniref:peptidylprolyl isomerase n=1 Tax=Noctiluca scintillans TaxID=2966 RepID=A0A7S0ZPD9_NOCSC
MSKSGNTTERAAEVEPEEEKNAPEEDEADDENASREAAPEEPQNLENAEEVHQSERDKGNEEYEQGKYEDALKSWGRSLMSVEYILNKGYYNTKPDELEEVHRMEVRLCLNMAQGNLKTGDHEAAIKYADRALKREPMNSKGLYRKATALLKQLQYREAIAVLERLLQHEPEGKAARELLSVAKRKAAISSRTAKRVSKQMMSALGSQKDDRVPLTEREQLVRNLKDIPMQTRRGISSLQDLLRRWRRRCCSLCSKRKVAQRPKEATVPPIRSVLDSSDEEESKED